MPSKLEQLQQQYRRQLLQEKEERMIKIHTESQQKALSKVARYNGYSSVPTVHSQPPVPVPHHSPVKKGSPGVDRSRPLPPITKERSNVVVANRTSPVSAPTDSVTKVVTSVSSRSRSVEFVESRTSPPRFVDSRQSPPRFAPQNEPGNGAVRRFGADATDSRQSPPKVSVQDEPISNATLRNGYTRTTEAESPKPSQPAAEPERRPDPETLARLKQAELQRLRAKTRDETPPRSNGVSGAISKSSTVQKKTPVAKPQATSVVTTPRSRQTTSRKPPVPSFRNAAAPRSRAAANAAPQSSSSNAGARKPPGPGQEQCRVCGRNFNADRIEKHVSICAKAAQKKTKVFDATKMRVKGTEAEQFVRRGGALKAEPPKAKKSDWRKKHSDFIEAIRQAKMVQQHLAKGGKVSDLPPPPPSDTSDYVPCPYCNRKFSESVAERHIPKCKNILSNKKNPPPRRK